MDHDTEEILKGLRTAMEAELTGHAFYNNAAKNTDDPMAKETFSQMAEEEMSHFSFLRRQYKAVMEQGDYDMSQTLLSKTGQHADNPIFGDDFKERIKDAHFEVSALTIGMKLELDAMNYYRMCAKETKNEGARQFFLELAEWEKDHYIAFEQALSALKEDYFAANNFVPM